MIDILIKYPTRARPARFCQTLQLYLRDPSARLLVTIDEDDATMNHFETGFHLDQSQSHRVKVRRGRSKGKVEAINDGVAEEPWDLLILASDDMIPQRPDYAQRIAQLFAEFFPNGDGVLHLNDGRVGRVLNTLPILDRKYFDRFNYIYNPVYTSLFCDDEFQAVAERAGKSIYLDEVIIRHEWVGEGGGDALHARNESYYAADGAIFEQRKAAGFPA